MHLLKKKAITKQTEKKERVLFATQWLFLRVCLFLKLNFYIFKIQFLYFKYIP